MSDTHARKETHPLALRKSVISLAHPKSNYFAIGVLVFDGDTNDIHTFWFCVQGYSWFSQPQRKESFALAAAAYAQPPSSMTVNNAGRDGISKCLKSIKLSLMDGFIVGYKSRMCVGPEPTHLNEVKFIFMNSRAPIVVFSYYLC